MIKIHPIKFQHHSFPVAADQFFDYEFGKDKWYWSSIEKADFFATMSGSESWNQVKLDQWEKYKKPILFIHVTHYADGQDEMFRSWEKLLPNNSYVVCDLNIKNSPPYYIFTPFTKNVVSSYATNFKFTFPFEKFYYIDPRAFDKINKNFDPALKTRIFISPNKTHPQEPRSCLIRKKITHTVYNNYRHLGHIGNKDELGIWLADNRFEASSVDELIEQTKNKDMIIAFGMNYPHILYYQDTFITFCGETYEGAERNGAYGVTEKSWIPMMQGHFILPFGAAGIINYMKSLGFMFPTEINYSYDSCEDYNTRVDMYMEELHRLCNISLDNWKNIYSKNVEILKHNQSLILDSGIEKCNLLERIGLKELANAIQQKN